MRLYHGTNQDILSINLNIGLKYKDFGQGFYLTPDYQTARKKASLEWAEFIDSNRSRTGQSVSPTYDIIVGPIANDGVAYLLGRYHEGTKTLIELANELQDRFLDQQYCFGTQRALAFLVKVKAEII